MIEEKEVVLSEEEIETICTNIASSIDEIIQGDERLPLFVGVMDGAIQFFAHLFKHIQSPALQEFIKLKSYSGSQTTGVVTVKKDLQTDINGRTVVIVEDVIDSGYTMQFLREYLPKKGNPKRVLIAALLDKTYARKVDVKIDFVGKVIESPDYLMGFGLDYDGIYRNVSHVYIPTEREIENMKAILEKDKNYYKDNNLPEVDCSKVHVFDHPLLRHKISLLRPTDTPSSKFRELVKEIAMLEAYEVFKYLPVELKEIETPIEKTTQPFVNGENICVVPILRAGLGMVEGVTSIVPNARVGHLGLYRDEETHQPHTYYCRLPVGIEDLDCYIVDPMLATGGSLIDAVKILREHGAKKITAICIIAAPEGVKKFAEVCPDIPLFVGCLDRCLNDKAYICPGLGDAGDRIFGTELPAKKK